ncbi:MAG: hypothetical protein Kow0032_29560 [Methyloligellaceae bacterium]
MRTHVVTKEIPRDVPALAPEQIAEIAEILRLMGEPSRLRILLACLGQPGAVGEIAARVGIPRSLVSHHLRHLRASRLLRAEKSGKQVIYSLLDDRVRCIIADLANHVLEPEDREGAADE